MHVLVVDDNKELADYAAKFLKILANHTADVALSAKEALKLASEREYGAILTEFRLPHENVGLNLAKSLRDQGFEGLIIGLVSITRTFTVEKMTEMGFNACLRKPLLEKDMDVLKMRPGTVLFEGDDLSYEKDQRSQR